MILFVGLIVHGFFAECLMKRAALVVGNPSFVKRVIFPLEILPWPMLLSAAVPRPDEPARSSCCTCCASACRPGPWC